MKHAVFFILMLMLGCSNPGEQVVSKTDLEGIKNTTLTPTEFVAWSDDVTNYQSKTQQIAEMKYTLTHLSAEYLAMQELGVDASKEAIDSLKTNYSEMMYFRLRIEADGYNQELLKYQLAEAAEYERRVRYCSFDIASDLQVEKAGELPLMCGLSHFERSFDVAPFVTIMLGFDRKDIYDKNNNVVVTYNDNLFGKGLVKFSWTKDELEAIPSITN